MPARDTVARKSGRKRAAGGAAAVARVRASAGANRDATRSTRPVPTPPAGFGFRKPLKPQPVDRRPKQPTRRPARRIAYWSTVLSLWSGIALAALLLYYATDLPDTSALHNVERGPGVTFLAADGTVLTRRGQLYGVPVAYEDLPPHLVEAVLAIEDRRFFYHFGIDPIGLVRAALANVRAGTVVQGGSTISQQLAKNLFLKPERTWKRKAQEMMLALWLEWEFSKREILTLYLNRVYFGAGAYGVEAAAQRYFSKPVTDLSLGESAMLAGLLKAPSRFSPANNINRARARSALVLEAMVAQGYLSAAEVQAADQPRLAGTRADQTRSLQYVADWLLERVPGFVGSTEGDIVVRSTIDPMYQRVAERVVSEALTKEGAALGARQAALIAIDGTGAVKAMVGGRSYGASQFNRATQARRQPGSAFKPFVYLAALEAGLSPETVRLDGPITVAGWSPRNYSGKYEGEMTLKQALGRSVNTVAVRVSQEVGRRRVVETAHRLGIVSPLAAHPSVALGTSEVTEIELTAAYVPFSNGGYAVVPHGIVEVSQGDGTRLYERTSSGPRRVVKDSHLLDMNRMLSWAVSDGTGKAARLDGRPQAGKTGTSQDFRDAWFIGYTADLTVGVWVGNDDNSRMDEVTGGKLPAQIWQAFMLETQAGVPPKPLSGSRVVPSGPASPSPSDDNWTPTFLDRLFGAIDARPPEPAPSRRVEREGFARDDR